MDQQGSERAADSHIVEVANSLAQELTNELEMLKSLTAGDGGGSSPPSDRIIICKVGDRTRNVDEGEYDPHYVSVGPYHLKRNPDRPDIVRVADKMTSLGAVLSVAAPRKTMEDYINELTSLEASARSWYAHVFDGITSKEFVRMLLLDGCYVLSRFVVDRRDRNGTPPTANGHVQGGGAHGGNMLEFVAMVRDVFYLAENQIPFFVVDKIYELTFPDSNGYAVDGFVSYVVELLQIQQYSMPVTPPPSTAPPLRPGNLLHLLHMHLVTTEMSAAPVGNAASKPVGRWRNATEYHFAGVKFKSRAISSTKGDAHSILDVKLDSGGGTLEVPRLKIDSETLCILRNLMVLEQRNPEAVTGHVTAYCIFLSQVACTAKDVELLSRRGVIVHGLGSHVEVAGYFADLCKGVVFDPNNPGCNYLRATYQALETRFQSSPRRWMAWLRQKYFSNPWLALGLMAAAIGLVCAVIQAVYSVLSYNIQHV